MWYLIDTDAGVLAAAPRKRDLSHLWQHSIKSHRVFGQPVYDTWMDDGRHHSLYCSREHAEADGFGFAIKVYHDGGLDCSAEADGRSCAYCLYGYCAKQVPPTSPDNCPTYPHG